jgi:16S rRNA (cytosine1402-N4)-methyltransferase
VNDELHSLEEVLPQALELLESNGRIAVISFHSLEDRIVKNVFKGFAESGLGKIITDKPIEPSLSEQEENKRSRSAKLRIFEKN